jgi:hypothetical protein
MKGDLISKGYCHATDVLLSDQNSTTLPAMAHAAKPPAICASGQSGWSLLSDCEQVLFMSAPPLKEGC